MAAKIEQVQQAKLQSAEELAAMLEPLAQAMAGLVDETRLTLRATNQTIHDCSQLQQQELGEISKKAQVMITAAEKAAEKLNEVSQNLERQNRRQMLISAVLGGLISAVLVSGFWLLLAPPKIQNVLDPTAVVELLRPLLETR
jgi:ABC-type transporter Mla subunit MlaD